MRIIDIDDLKKEHEENILNSEENKTAKILAIESFIKISKDLTDRLSSQKVPEKEILSLLKDQFWEVFYHHLSLNPMTQRNLVEKRMKSRFKKCSTIIEFYEILTDELFIVDENKED